MASVEDKIELLEALEARLYLEARNNLTTFSETVEVPGAPIEESEKFYGAKLKLAPHHRLILKSAQDLMDSNDLDGLLIMMPPGSAKSTMASVIVPAWVLGRKPGTNVIAVTYGTELTARFARRVRQICRDPIYQKIMGCTIVADNAAVEQWGLTNGSDYKASAVGAAITGTRSDLTILDDLIKDRADADSELIRNKTWDAYIDNISTRSKPGGKMIWMGTRWHTDDWIGRMLTPKWGGQSGLWRTVDGRLFKIINLPMIAEHKDDPIGREKGEMLWKSWFRESEVKRLQEAAKGGGSAARSWSALYQQRPTLNEGAILPRHYWKAWEKKDLPDCKEIYLCYDTAFEEDEAADFSAMTAWGVFQHISRKSTGEEFNHDHIILLGAWKDKVSAVDLIDTVQEHCRWFKPELVLIEKRASGIQLIQEMRRRRLPVKAWLPKGKPGAKGKVPRAYHVATLIEMGSVWYVPGSKTEEVLADCAAFPYGASDDAVDTVTCALSYFRDRFLFGNAEDELDEDEIKDRMLQRSEDRRSKRSLYSGPVNRSGSDYDAEEIKNMTPETRRRLYG